jgi:hypothetical protein
MYRNHIGWPLHLLGVLFAGAIGVTSWLIADDLTQPSSAVAPKSQLHREGTELRDEPGRFLSVGNRQSFVSTNGTTYVVLENLNLERVGKIVDTSPEAVDWFISGKVTEYQGANYLLISRARRKASTAKLPRGF